MKSIIKIFSTICSFVILCVCLTGCGGQLKSEVKLNVKGNYKEFISIMNHNYHEEVLIHGLILGYIKDPMNYLAVEAFENISFRMELEIYKISEEIANLLLDKVESGFLYEN